MRTKSSLIVGLIPFLGWQQMASRGDEPVRAKDNAPGPPAVLRVSIQSTRPTYHAKIDRVADDGTLWITRPDDIRQPNVELRAELTEGYYLGVVQESCASIGAGAKFVRVVVTEIGENGSTQVHVGNAAVDAIKPGEYITLCRPAGSTTAALRQLPDLAPLTRGESPWPKSDAERVHCLQRTAQNLRGILFALLRYEGAYGRFPPAAVIAPDGKPWHSWRVLVLPYLAGGTEIYEAYKWDEPWDGPNNSQLLAKMPPEYSDPIYGENKEFFTHYAAITGDVAAFAPGGSRFDGKELNVAKLAGRQVRHFTDGTSNSLMIGPIGPDRRIPWMKPEDIVVGAKFPRLGTKRSFALPYSTKKGWAGPFVRADGMFLMIPGKIDPEAFLAALTIAAGDVPDWQEILGGDLPAAEPYPLLIITSVDDPAKPTARIISDQ